MSTSTPVIGEQLLDVSQVARKLGIAERTVWRWEELGKIPKRAKSERKYVRWLLSDIEAYQRGEWRPEAQLQAKAG